MIIPERMQLWWQEGSDGYLCEFCVLDSFVSPFFLVTVFFIKVNLKLYLFINACNVND